MTEKKHLRITISPSGEITAVIEGIKGEKCLDYIPLIQDLVDANINHSEYTQDFFHSTSEEETLIQNINMIKNDG
ncbi:MAG: DUF2997 domain-containing protein [Cycloclasticus sp.]|jgi:Protein of unknown function (DUF2997).